MATDSFADAVASCRYLRNNVQWTTGRKRMIGIMAAIRTAMHNADSRQPIRNPNRSPRIDRLMDASIRWAEPIMSKIDLPCMACSCSGPQAGHNFCRNLDLYAALGVSRLRALLIKTAASCDFETNARMPIKRACCSKNLSANALYIINGTEGMSRFRIRAASSPFMPGMERSITIKSGRSC